MSDHARIGPSALDRIENCLYSVILSESIPPRASGAAADAGTIMHTVIERALTGGDPVISDLEAQDLDALDFGREFCQDIVDRALAAFTSIIERFDLGALNLERRVYPGRLTARDDFWGTADFYSVSRDCKTLVVADFKSGRVKVDPTFNSQALAYAVGVIAALDETTLANIERVAIAIVQPRCYPAGFAIWECAPALCFEYAAHLTQHFKALDTPETLRPEPGPHCQYCPGLKVCSAHAAPEGVAMS